MEVWCCQRVRFPATQGLHRMCVCVSRSASLGICECLPTQLYWGFPTRTIFGGSDSVTDVLFALTILTCAQDLVASVAGETEKSNRDQMVRRPEAATRPRTHRNDNFFGKLRNLNSSHLSDPPEAGVTAAEVWSGRLWRLDGSLLCFWRHLPRTALLAL